MKTTRPNKRKRQAGFLYSMEAMFFATIIIIGLIIGMVSIRDALVAEMHDMAESFGVMDQSWEYEGILDLGTNAQISGAEFNDSSDDNLGGAATIGAAGTAGDQTGVDFNVAFDDDEEANF